PRRAHFQLSKPLKSVRQSDRQGLLPLLLSLHTFFSFSVLHFRNKMFKFFNFFFNHFCFHCMAVLFQMRIICNIFAFNFMLQLFYLIIFIVLMSERSELMPEYISQRNN